MSKAVKRKDNSAKTSDDELEGCFGPKIPLKIGPHGTHNGLVFPLREVTIEATVEEQVEPECLLSHATITYIYENTYREAELWYPVGELGGVMSFTIEVNGADAHCRTQYEFSPDGVPPRIRMPPQGLPNDEKKPNEKRIKYYYWLGEQLEDMDPGTLTTVVVKYDFLVPPVGKELHSWILPLSVIPQTPKSFTLKLNLLKDITSVTCSNLPKGLGVDMKGKEAVVTLQSPKSLDLSEHYLLLKFSTYQEPWDPFNLLLGIFLTLSVILLSILLYILSHPDALRGLGIGN